MRRHVEPTRLTSLVRGDLDWIIMKALDKDRNRRYETANALAMDIQRHLSGRSRAGWANEHRVPFEEICQEAPSCIGNGRRLRYRVGP